MGRFIHRRNRIHRILCCKSMRLALIYFLFPFFSFSQSQIETVIQKGHELAVVTLAISPDSNYVVTGSRDKSAKLWEMSTGREVRSFLGHEATVTSLEFTSDGKWLISGSNDKSIRFWDIATGKENFVIHTPDIITDIGIDPKLIFFAVAGYGNSGYGDSVTIYDLNSKKEIKKISASADKGLGSGIDVAISPDGKLLALGEDHRTVNLYQTSDWSKVNTFQFEEGYCGGCGTRSAFSPDSKYLYYATNNGPIRKYDLNSFKLLKTFEEKVEDLKGFALSPDGKKLAVSTEKKVTIWNELSGDPLSGVEADEKGELHEIAFTFNSKML